MHLTDIIQSAVDRLPVGAHDVGLRSVVTHIERAIVNLERGQQDGDDEWFRDAIYRCNQAFEGSVKEAYRVLAEGDPTKKTPHEIEIYIDSNEILRPRVFNQLTRYRREWRNPSTHDYNLDFDENEAFLAVVNVCAFAKVLIDQIALKLAYDASAHADTQVPLSSATDSFAEEVATQVAAVFSVLGVSTADDKPLSEAHWIGSLAGYLDAVEGIESEIEAHLPGNSMGRADMIVRRGGEATVIELKRNRRRLSVVDDAKAQLGRYLDALALKEGVLAFFDEKAVGYTVEEERLGDLPTKFFVVRPLNPEK